MGILIVARTVIPVDRIIGTLDVRICSAFYVSALTELTSHPFLPLQPGFWPPRL